MTKQVQRRRGTAAQHTSFTGAEGEISVNTTNKSVHVHDGVTAGGVEAARADLTNVSDANLNSALSGNTLSSLTITSADINGGTIDGTVIGGSSPAAGTFSSATVNGNIAVTGTVDGRDVASDGSKLDGIEAGADVTDTANVTSAGALMDSELTDIAAVKALDQGVATTDDPTFTGVDLAAIAASKAVTAVDVFVYDTSRDSDGGAWRKRTQHTSWYNETLNTATRGARREFPAVAVIVAETNKVTIYDGDDPALPIWMVFTPSAAASTPQIWRAGRLATSVVALNGTLGIGAVTDGQGGLILMDLIVDRMSRYAADVHTGGISVFQRNEPLTTSSLSSQRLVNALVNDVAMTVLPDAPIDPATGLPVPTIAVATDGGVSVIKDDGTVVDIVSTGNASTGLITFPDTLRVAFTQKTTGQVHFYNIPTVDVSVNFYGDVDLVGYHTTTTPAKLGFGTSDITNSAFGASVGLTVLAENTATPANGMVAYTTSTYNTGWMPGAIRGAFLSDTDDTDLVGSGELVTNGTFDTDVSGWTDASVGTESPSVSSGQLSLPRVDASNEARLQQAITTVAGQSYTVSVDVISGTLYLFVGTAAGFSNILVAQPAVPASYTFVASGSTTYLQLASRFAGTAVVDNISVKLADADRSVAQKGLIVNGTITRAPVADGAELVAYSGFSASNYLEQPYNSALDFGTGDFCVMGWAKVASNGNQTLFERYDGSTPANRLSILASGAVLQAHIGGYRASSFSFSAGQWAFVVALRSSGVFKMFANGVQVYSGNHGDNLSNGANATRIGVDRPGVWPLSSGSLALWRLSATAPTAEQISRIYNDEKHLFTENAACTIAGTSDAVTALAHDSTTNLLHVGSSYGRSVFQGLRRVDAVAGAVGTAISAENGLVVSE